jgi:hypothetical protein
MSKVLQQQWELVTTENGTWMSTTHEWRDVPTATDDLSNTPK